MLELLVLYLCLSIVRKSDAIVLSPGWRSNATPDEKFVESSNAFAVHVYRYLSSREGNIFFCPLCLSSSLTVLLEGSKGRTQYELNDTLEFKATRLSQESVRKSCSNLTKRIQEKDCFSKAASALFIQENAGLDDRFMNSVQDVYNTEIKMADFRGNAQKAAWDVNEWIKQKTKSKMKRIVEWVDANTQMLLVNGVYLRTDFSGVFSPELETRDRFRNHGIDDHVVNVTMMQRKGHLQRLATSYDFRALELPCAGSNETSIKMWILLPHRVGRLSEVEDGLRTSTFKQISNSFQEYDVDIAVPSVRIEYFRDISKILQQVGVKDAFSKGKADFSTMSERNSLYLTQVIQKAVIEITESKLEDFSTSDFIDYVSPSSDDTFMQATLVPPFKADHPFLFFVMDTSSGLILHMGRLLEF